MICPAISRAQRRAIARTHMRSFAIAGLLGLAVGCATRPAVNTTVAPPAEASAPAPKKMKLAVLPVEKLVQPKLAEALNERLTKASVSGVSETTTAAISMGMAMLQEECAQPTEECYGKIARKLEADRLLWGEIEQKARPKKKKAAGPTTVRIVMFDVVQASIVGHAEETFSGPVPNEALDEMLARATAGTGGKKAISP
jgi:hypothetical protein